MLIGSRSLAHGGTDQAMRRSFGLAVMAGIAASPIVWPHYLTLVFVPIALLSPRFSALWLVPLLAYLAPTELTGGQLANMLPYLAIELIVFVSLCVPSRERRERVSPSGRSLFADTAGGRANARRAA